MKDGRTLFIFFPVSQLGGSGREGEAGNGFFFPLVEPLCAFDPWHLPAKGEGRASPALPSNGSCKRRPKCASSALGNFWVAANFSKELDRFGQPETITRRAGQGAAGSLGAPLHGAWWTEKVFSFFSTASQLSPVPGDTFPRGLSR